MEKKAEGLLSKLHRCLKVAVNDEKLECQVGHIVLELAEVMKNPDYNSPILDEWCDYFLSKNDPAGESGDVDARRVTVLVRDTDGKRTTLSYDTWGACCSQAGVDIDEDDEILIVRLGNAVVYSRLAAGAPIGAEELSGFFA